MEHVLSRALHREVRHSLRSGTALTTESIRQHIHPVLESGTPSVNWLRAQLSDDEMVLEVGPNRWVRVDAVLDGRVLTLGIDPDRLVTAEGQMGDLGVLLRRYPHWARMPAVSEGRRTVLDVEWSDGGTPQLRWSRLLPTGLVGVVTGPEGLSIGSVRIDGRADADLARALRGVASIARRRNSASSEPQTDTQTVYAALASHQGLLTRPARPLGEVLPTVRSRAA